MKDVTSRDEHLAPVGETNCVPNFGIKILHDTRNFVLYTGHEVFKDSGIKEFPVGHTCSMHERDELYTPYRIYVIMTFHNEELCGLYRSPGTVKGKVVSVL
jgi:hypothetical protein